MHDKYSLHTNPLIVAPWFNGKSYIGAHSALYFHGLISQLPQNIFCITNARPKKIKVFGIDIIYKHSKNIFGYCLEKYEGFKLPVSSPEKAIIDSIGVMPMHIVLENIQSIDKQKLFEIAKKCSPSTKRRIIGE